MTQLILSYPWWFLVLCLILGGVYATILYYGNPHFQDKKRLNTGLALLRGLTVSIIAFLLLNPMLKRLEEFLKPPMIVIGLDQSTSVGTQESVEEILSQVDDWVSNLGEEFQVETKRIGSGTQTELDSVFEETETDIAAFLSQVENEYAHLNLQAIILASDGIYNKGRNPLYVETPPNVPIHTVLLGDTVRPRDLNIKNLFHNKVTFLGDQFEVEVDLEAQYAAGSSSQVQVFHFRNGQFKLTQNQNVQWKGNQDFQTLSFLLDAQESGVERYQVRVSPLDGEENVRNNQRDLFIEVLDSRKKVVLLRDAPHPDITAIKQMANSQENLELIVTEPDNYREDILQADLLIVHGLPHRDQPLTELPKLISEVKIPVLYILDGQTEVRRWSQMQNYMSVRSQTKAENEVTPRFNPDFNLFEFDNQFRLFEETPPLTVPFGEYILTKGEVLAYQRIDGIDTDYPLIVLTDEGGLKSGVIAGSGIWRWRMADYYQNKSFEVFDGLFSRMVQYLSLKENRDQFRVSSGQNRYDEKDMVVFSAELYNSSYELINDPEVNITLRSSTGQEYPYTFTRTEKRYNLDIKNLPVGSYSYTAKTRYNGQELTQKGQLVIQEIELEYFNTVADHGLLRALSRQTSGQSFSWEQANTVVPQLLTNPPKPVIDYQSRTKSLIHIKWLLGFIILLLSVEWFLRRYYGRY